MEFRKDINGLRAIAVVAVVIFHFNVPWLPGGFAGVDVFFVISGYLMTGIIFRSLEKDNFSIVDFCLRRARRILPALVFLCTVLLFFGWFYITPVDYKTLGKHIGSSISFMSNMVYWSEAGYFDVASNEKWLLHTWSLSVEGQFYFLYPIVLAVLKKFLSLKALKLTVLLGCIISFIFCVAVTYQWPEASYFMLPSRVWEMLIGAVAYLYPIHFQAKNKKIVEWAGLALIIGSYIFISQTNLWPGYLALFPVLGTFIFIQAQTENNIVTDNLISQKIGTWSYSIYLWHWPLVVSINYYSLSESFIYIGIALSLILGFLSYTYVERIKLSSKKISNYKHLYIALWVIAISSLVFFTNGFESHYAPSVVQADKESLNRNPYKCMDNRDDFGPCYIGNKDNIKAIIVGDSHADALTTSLTSAIDLNAEGIIALVVSSCPFILEAKIIKYSGVCYSANTLRMKYLVNNYDDVPVFWAARSAVYIYGLSNLSKITDIRDTMPLLYFTKKHQSPNDKIFAELKTQLEKTILQIKSNHPVYMIHPTPGMRKNIPKRLSRNILLGLGKTDLSISYNSYQERNHLLRELITEVSKTSDAKTLDPIPYLCKDGRCMAQHQGRPLYYDSDHLSEFGNKLLTPMFKKTMANH